MLVITHFNFSDILLCQFFLLFLTIFDFCRLINQSLSQQFSKLKWLAVILKPGGAKKVKKQSINQSIKLL